MKMKNHNKEYNESNFEYSEPGMEYAVCREDDISHQEYFTPGEEYHVGREEYSSELTEPQQETESRQHLKLIKKMGFLVAASVATAVISIAALSTDNLTAQSSQLLEEQADKSFPELSNLEPLGSNRVAYMLSLGDQIIINEEPDSEYLVTPSGMIYRPAMGIIDVSYDGISYDLESNTLYLNEYQAEDYIVANAMGNGFTIDITGSCSVGGIISYGWNYGGSITIQGTGTLKVNEAGGYDTGIYLMSEMSDSCIMIKPGVTVEVWGQQGAILVEGTSCEKGLYYLEPLKLEGGVRHTEPMDLSAIYNLEPGHYQFIDENNEIKSIDNYNVSTILDQKGSACTHIRLSGEL